jgi:hypothetical protein
VNEIGEVPWWQEPEQLAESDQQQLLRAAVSVLVRHGEADVDIESIPEMPPRALAAELSDALEERDLPVGDEVVSGLVDGQLGKEATPGLLRELGREQWLREAITDAYRARRELMVVEPASWALTAGLVLLIVKLRRIRIDKTGVDLQFDPVREGVVQQVLGSLGS